MTAVILIVLSLVCTVPAFAEHKAESQDLDIEVKVGRDHFRVGGRLFGPSGVGAWLNGRLRPGGLSLDGRVQRDERRVFNFTLDADLLDWLPR
jgi:hypothetical protein